MKEKQYKVLKSVVLGRNDLLTVPTGYMKSRILIGGGEGRGLIEFRKNFRKLNEGLWKKVLEHHQSVRLAIFKAGRNLKPAFPPLNAIF